MTVKEIAAQYPHLEPDDIRVALEYAAQRFERQRARV